VLSDIELPSINNAADVGERSLPNAMPCDAVTSADHLEQLQLNLVKPYLAELQARSHQRVEKDTDFNYVREDIEEYRKEQADKSLSLNLAERMATLKTDNARAEARKTARLSRKKTDEKIYEIRPAAARSQNERFADHKGPTRVGRRRNACGGSGQRPDAG
jgi:carboxyl-terminal processing protease